MKWISDHSERWKTALLMAIAVMAVWFLDNATVTWIFLGIVYMTAFSEALKLFDIEDARLYLLAGAVWIATPFYPHPTDLLFASSALIGAMTAYDRRISPKAIFPILYPGAGVLFLWLLYREYGMDSLLWIVVIVAATDVGAFYSGKRFGKRPFSPTSPKKTLEGVAGGVAAGTILGAWLMVGHYNIFINSIFVAFVVSISSVFGDLFESYLKREAGVKDSGTLLPGHGGVLDRVDGYLFASVALYILLKITGS